MPNRIIKDSIHTSEKINALTDFQFRLWVNLITYVDDYGRGDARPAVIKGSCFPLRDRMTNLDIEAALAKLAGAGCVGLYEVDGKPYLYFPNWESHQRIRQKVSKFPEPPLCGNSRQSAATCGDSRPESESNPNPNPESESKEIGAEQPCGRSTPPTAPSGFNIPLNDGSMYNVPLEDVAVYKQLYTAVDVEAELRGMIGWCMSNPKRRKTNTGIKSFITRWLKKTQDAGGSHKRISSDSQYAQEDDFY